MSKTRDVTETRVSVKAPSFWERLLTRVGGVMELPLTLRIRMVAVLSMFTIGFLIATQYILFRLPSFSGHIAWEGAHGIQSFELYTAIGWVGIIALGFVAQTSEVKENAYEFIGLQYYAITFGWIAYQLGSASFLVGVLAVGSATIGFILFSARAVVAGLFTGAAILIGTSVASAMGDLAYAPVYALPGYVNGVAEPTWLLNEALLALPFVLGTLFISFVMLAKWSGPRDRGLVQVSSRDPLTGVANRSVVIDAIRVELFSGDALYHVSTSIILVDIDDFKAINDEHGHSAGDRALIATATAIEDVIRTSDVVGRYQGGSFLILLRRANLEAAEIVAGRCRIAISQMVIDLAFKVELQVTASFAIGEYRDPESLEAFVDRVDTDLHKSKKKGSKRIGGGQASVERERSDSDFPLAWFEEAMDTSVVPEASPRSGPEKTAARGSEVSPKPAKKRKKKKPPVPSKAARSKKPALAEPESVKGAEEDPVDKTDKPPESSAVDLPEETSWDDDAEDIDSGWDYEEEPAEKDGSEKETAP